MSNKGVELKKNMKSLIKNIELIMNKNNIKKIPRIVAVSKTKPFDMIKELYFDDNIKHRHFGENYVNELIIKSEMGNKMKMNDIKWHFIGHLQSNKCKDIIKVNNLFMIESIDSIKIAKELNKKLSNINKILNIMIQINTTNENQKSGILPSECIHLLKYILNDCKYLKFCGLMTIGKYGDINNKYFNILIQLRNKISKEFNININDIELSMGMSNDYELAIISGSTNIRVGSTIFGQRIYNNKSNNDHTINTTNNDNNNDNNNNDTNEAKSSNNNDINNDEQKDPN